MRVERTVIIRESIKRGILVREKLILVREKSVKSQGILFQTKSGHPVHAFTFSLLILCIIFWVTVYT